MARRLGVPGACAACAAVPADWSRDGGRDLLFRSCAVSGVATAGGTATRAVVVFDFDGVVAVVARAAAVVGVVRLVPVDVVEPSEAFRITMDTGLVAEVSGGYLLPSFRVDAVVVVVCDVLGADVVAVAATFVVFLPSDIALLGAAAVVTEEALEDELPGLFILPLVDLVGPVAEELGALLVAVEAGFIGSRLGEALRLGSWLRSVDRSVGGRAVAPAGLRSDRALVRDDMAAVCRGEFSVQSRCR